MYKVKFMCDKSLSHTAPHVHLVNESEETFQNFEEAEAFHNECTEPITEIGQLIKLRDRNKEKKSIKSIDI